MKITVIEHPIVGDRLSALRDGRTNPGTCRSILRELGALLVYEACRDLPTRRVEVETPIDRASGVRIDQAPLIVPILRGGLDMANGGLGFFPDAGMGFIGLSRNIDTHEPNLYLSSLPDDLTGRQVFVVDPMLASGRSVIFGCRLLAERGCDRITVVCAIAALPGLAALDGSGLVGEVVTAAVDESLNSDGYVVPGMGDAGDRQYADGDRIIATAQPAS